MELTDLTVEVRDKSLRRLGVIRHEDLNLNATAIHNDVGAWSLVLPIEHHLCDALRTPGAGIVVTGPNGELFSGPVTDPEYTNSPGDPLGSVVFTGVTDEIALVDALCYPDPANPDPTTQTLTHDKFEAPVETIMHALVARNIGPAATAPRRKAGLTMGPNLGRGGVVKKSVRFKNLGTALRELADSASLGFRVVQRGNGLRFETYPVADRSRLVRLDARNNTLSSQRVKVTAPTATHVIVAGQDEGVERQFLLGTNPESIEAAVLWGRRIERWTDQRHTDDVDEHAQAAAEILAEEGFTSVQVQAVPMADSSLNFGIDWYVGDLVSVVVLDQELKTVVTGFVVQASSQGFHLGATLGDPRGFDLNASLRRSVRDNQRRLDALEANAESSASLPATVADLEAEVEQQDAAIASTVSRIGALESDVTDMAGDVAAAALAFGNVRTSLVRSVQVNVPAGAAGIGGSTAISFPAGTFTEAPYIFVSQQGIPGGTALLIVKSIATSATAASIYAYSPVALGAPVTVTVRVWAVEVV